MTLFKSTFSKFIGLLLVFSFSHAKNSLMIPMGVPLLVPSNCSGAPFKSEQLNLQKKSDEIYFLSAAHCFGSEPNKYENPGYAFQSSQINGVFNPFKSGLQFSYEMSTSYQGTDQFITTVNKIDEKNVKIFDLADDTPLIGSQVKVYGYSAKGIPLLLSVATESEFNCVYMGPIMTQVSYNSIKNKLTVLDLLKCDRQQFVQGASGGPVLNSQGQLIGNLSMFVDNKHVEDSQTQYLIFSRLTENEINLRFTNATENKTQNSELIPKLNGTRLYQNLNYLKLNPNSSIATLVSTSANVPFVNEFIHGTLQELDHLGQPISNEVVIHGVPQKSDEAAK